jgi:peptidoglycan/LPS O-acetylase OafA/YrhL
MPGTPDECDWCHADFRAMGGRNRLRYLDGCRALAALLVVVTHVRDVEQDVTLPQWFEVWFNLGHYAVTVFLVISGFSLGIGWVSKRTERGWVSYFIARRAWRIIPTYWAALVLSVLLAVAFNGEVDWSGVAVHGALMQDFLPGADPNGVLWSIAIEWHIYFLFPLVLALSLARSSAPAMVGVVVLIYALWATGDFYFDGFTPQYVACFALGVWAGVTEPTWRVACVGAAAAGAFTAILYLSPMDLPATNALVDLPLAAASAALFGMMRDGRMTWLARMVALRPLPELGVFAYSIYLVHAPVLWHFRDLAIGPMGLPGTAEFATLLITGPLVAVLVAYVFYLAAERPFLGQPPFMTRGARRRDRSAVPVLPRQPDQRQVVHQ